MTTIATPGKAITGVPLPTLFSAAQSLLQSAITIADPAAAPAINAILAAIDDVVANFATTTPTDAQIADAEASTNAAIAADDASLKTP